MELEVKTYACIQDLLVASGSLYMNKWYSDSWCLNTLRIPECCNDRLGLEIRTKLTYMSMISSLMPCSCSISVSVIVMMMKLNFLVCIMFLDPSLAYELVCMTRIVVALWHE